MMLALLGPQIESDLDNYFASEHHALTIIGPELSSLANAVSQKLRSIEQNLVIMPLKPEKSTITIEQIRAVKHSFSLKQTGNQQRVLLVESAETMSLEAQNSLLKLLEEPPSGVRFILLVSHKAGLISTIISRSRIMQLRPLTIDEALGYQQNDITKQAIQRAYAISEGMPGKLFLLLSDRESDYSEAIDEAKYLIGADSFKRLSKLEQLAKDKQRAQLVLEAVDDVLRAVSHSSSSKADKIKQLAAKRKVVYEGRSSLQRNVNTKLVLLDVFMAL